MAELNIPKGEDFSFSVIVKENDSFLSQDLTNIVSVANGEATNPTIKIFDTKTQTCVLSESLTVPTFGDTAGEAALPQINVATVAVVADETTYFITVNGTKYSYVSGIGATDLTIAAGLVSAMAVNVIQNVVDNLDGTITLTGNDGEAVTYTISDNMFITNTQVYKYAVDAIVGAEQNALNGRLECTIPGTKTDLLNVNIGPEVDRFYLKSVYSASITIEFTDGTLPITVYIDQIYVIPTGSTCV